MKNQWKLFIDHIPEQDETLIEITDQEYLTTKKLLSFGIWCCGNCGNLMPAEENRCKDCKKEKFIVTEKIIEEQKHITTLPNQNLNDKDYIDELDKIRNEKADRIGLKKKTERSKLKIEESKNSF